MMPNKVNLCRRVLMADDGGKLFGYFDAGAVKLPFFPPAVMDGRVRVSPPQYVRQNDISLWSNSLVGQFLGNPSPFFQLKNWIDVN